MSLGFADIIASGSRITRFCIGRRVGNVPIGLIVYAGHNQYNHVNDIRLRETAASVFDRISRGHGFDDVICGPAFDLQR
jgi:hypothetical protein